MEVYADKEVFPGSFYYTESNNRVEYPGPPKKRRAIRISKIITERKP